MSKALEWKITWVALLIIALQLRELVRASSILTLIVAVIKAIVMRLSLVEKAGTCHGCNLVVSLPDSSVGRNLDTERANMQESPYAGSAAGKII